MTKGYFHIVDAPSIIYRCAFGGAMGAYRGGGLESPTGEATSGTFGYVRIVDEMSRSFSHPISHTAFCFDGRKPDLIKKKIDPSYKEGRTVNDPSIGVQLARSLSLTKLMGYRCVKEDGWEADDAIATLLRRFQGRVGGFVIVTCDKDMMQLMSKSKNVHIYHPFERRMLTRDDVKKKWGVPPSKVLEVMSLCGDMTDNVRGIPTVGAKTAARWIELFGSADEAAKAMSDSDRYGPKIRATDLPKVRKLMSLLTDCPCRTSLHKYENPGEVFNTEVLVELNKLGFNSITKKR